MAHRLFALLNIALVVGLAATCQPAVHGDPTWFVFAYCALRAVLVWQYASAWRHLPQARALTGRYAIGFSFAIVVWLTSLVLPWPWAAGVWALAIAVDFTVPFTDRSLAVKFPPDFTHVPERLGLFTIIVLGEAILAATSGLRYNDLSMLGGAVGLLGLVTAFATWWVYFEGAKGDQVTPPSEVRDVKRIQIWLYSHLPLAAGIVALGIGYKKAMLADPAAPIGSTGTLIAAAATLVMLSSHAVYRSVLNPVLANLYRSVNWPHNVVTVLGLPAIYLGPSLTPLALTGWLTGLIVAHVLLTMRELPEVEHLLAEQQRRAAEAAAGPRPAIASWRNLLR